MPRVFIFNYTLSKYSIVCHTLYYTIYSRYCKVKRLYIGLERILLVVNRADAAMSGRHWQDTPDETLANFLNEKAESIRKRIQETTGQWIQKPVCYSAAYRFNLYAFLDYIIDNAKSAKIKENEL
ncbi:hypothetical protein Holit_03141 [Hollandina sp. SP2]